MTDAKSIARAMRDKSRTLGKSHALLSGMSEEEWQPLAEAALGAFEPHISKPVPREPTDKMLDQGLVYLAGADRDALKAAWRVMYDMVA